MHPIYVFKISGQLLSYVQLFAIPWTVAHQASLSITSSWNLLKLMSIRLVMPSNHLILCCPFLLPAIFPSIRVFSNESVLWIRSSGVQSIEASASTLPMNIQGWFSLGLTDLFSLKSKGLPRVFSNTTVQKYQFFSAQPLYDLILTYVHDYWRNHSFDYMDLC